MSASAQPTGFPNNLTAEQEAKLRELWIMTLKVFGVDLSEIEKVAPRPATPQTPPPQERRPRRSMLNGIFGYRDEPPSESAPATTEAAESQNALNATVSAMSISDGDDKYGMSKQFQKIVNETPAEELRSSFWSMVKHNDPDSLLLRFLRARKWDVKQALIMFITTIHWRAREAHVDDDVMKNGDVLAFKQLQSSDPKEKKAGEEFLQQLRLGKNYFRGFDKSGRPICVIRVRKHRAGDQSVQVMERYTIYTIELARLMLADQVETATIVFDMSDFSMANMDYTPVKLMIKCFEANYPECLGAVLIHKAPWLFSGIWSIIKGWLDPVVASKVHFTNNDKDLENFIPRDRIVKELDGDDQWEFEYSEPNEGENEKMQDTATRDAIVARRDELSRRLEASTIKWIVSALKKDNDTKATAEQERREVTKQMNDQYWELDPYIRARSAYDRAGVIAGNGNINFYPDRRPSQVEPAKSNGGSAEKKKSISSTEIQPGVKDETAP